MCGEAATEAQSSWARGEGNGREIPLTKSRDSRTRIPQKEVKRRTARAPFPSADTLRLCHIG